MMSKEGNSVPQSNSEALKWYRKAIKIDNFNNHSNTFDDKAISIEVALIDMGGAYKQGLSVAQSHLKAIKSYRKVVNQGHASLQ